MSAAKTDKLQTGKLKPGKPDLFARGARVFSAPAGVPMLAASARALLDGGLAPLRDPADPLALAGVTVYVPTRRAARAFAQALTEAAGTRALVLPKIAPLGALEDEREGWPRDPEAEDLDPDPAIPQAVGDMARRLMLTRLILEWSRRLKGAVVWENGGPRFDAALPNLVASTPASAFALAGDLGLLIDEMIIEEIDWPRLEALASGDLDEYWRITLRFLDVARREWPRALESLGLVDAAERRARLIAREARKLREGRAGPVVALGSTGTNRATATLLAAIAANPQGAVVLPGLDRDLDDEGWNAIGWNKGGEAGFALGAGHAQTALRRLLDTLGVARRDVVDLEEPAPDLRRRARFVSEALRPADLTWRWRDRARRLPDAEVAQALARVALIEAADEREEALACAVLLREALETPGRRAALVTPDRGLARRVRAEMERWGVDVEDSGGEQVLRAPAGALAGLVVEAAAEGRGPAAVAAVLAHRDVRLGMARRAYEQAREDFEVSCLRGLPLDDALADPAGLLAAAKARAQERFAHPALKAMDEARWAGVETLLARLTQAFAPLEAPSNETLADWIDAHQAALAALTAVDAQENARQESARQESARQESARQENARQGRDRAALTQLLDETRASADAALAFTCEDYAAFFLRLAGSEVMVPEPGHPRLAILGQIEARLLDVDLVVLGGLDEGVWPQPATTDAFLNRPMRAAAGLSPPERRVGQAAHDFAMAMGAPQVALARSRRRGGAPTVASRLLQRMEAAAGDAANGVWAALRRRGEETLRLARLLDAPRPPDDPARAKPAERPAPAPPVELRPTALSVTRIETLRRDPYAIHAEFVLRLRKLDGYGLDEGPAGLGTALHETVARFAQDLPVGRWPDDAAARLETTARDVFAPKLADPAFHALEWPRLRARLARYLDWERATRETLKAAAYEARGEWTMTLDDGSPFRLSATADRIERHLDGGMRLVDFKTGYVPKPREVAPGMSPQLTLEAAIAVRGGFGAEWCEGAVSARYVALSADGTEELPPGGPKADFVALAEAHLEGARALLSAYRDPAQGYASEPVAGFPPRRSDVAHLARVKEWSAMGGEGGGEE